MNIKLTVTNEVRVQICEEAMDEVLPLLNYCITKHSDPEVRSNMGLMRDMFPKYVQMGNVEIIATASGFIKETYNDLITNKGPNVEPTMALFYLSEINAVLTAMTARLQTDAETAQKVFGILRPLQQNGLTPSQFISSAKKIIEELKAV